MEPSEALLDLQALLPDLSDWIIAREKHQDGSYHLHAYLESQSVISTTRPDFLDLRGHHPNIQAVRSANAVKKYVTKEGDFIARNAISTSTNPWKRARDLAREEGLPSALAALEEEPKTAQQLCVNGDRIRKNLTTLAAKRLKIGHPLDTFTGWNQTMWTRDTHALILTGPTNVGKTSLAKALLPRALFIRHLDRLREFDPDLYDGVILDDMAFAHLHREAQIALVDCGDDTDIHIRYTVAQLPAGTPRIFTTNRMPGDVFSLDDPAINRRVQCVRMLNLNKFEIL